MYTLLVAKIGPTRDGLQALLASIDDVELVAVTENMIAALAYTTATCPDLFIVTQNALNDRPADRFVKLRSQCVHTPILALVDSEASMPDMPERLIDIVLQTGIQSAEISQTIEALLGPQQSTP